MLKHLLYSSSAILTRNPQGVFPEGYRTWHTHEGYDVLELPIDIDLDNWPKRFLMLYEPISHAPDFLIAFMPFVRMDNHGNGRTADSTNGYASRKISKTHYIHYFYETGLRLFIKEYRQYFHNFQAIYDNLENSDI